MLILDWILHQFLKVLTAGEDHYSETDHARHAASMLVALIAIDAFVSFFVHQYGTTVEGMPLVIAAPIGLSMMLSSDASD